MPDDAAGARSMGRNPDGSWFELRVPAGGDAAWALSDRLTELGAASVSLAPAAGSDPQLEPEPGHTPLWPELVACALFSSEARAQSAQRALRAGGWTVRVAKRAARDWVAAGRAGFEPRRFGERLWIVPDWCEPPEPGAANVSLAPGLAFGTGSHPTTALCLAWLARAPVAGASVIDYGAGSGILALAAARLGAASVTAVDNDPQALEAVASNARRNRVTVRAVLPEALGAEPADILVANILARPLVSLAETLLAHVRPGGRVVLAGVTGDQADAVAAAYAGGARLDAQVRDGDWVRLEFTRTHRGPARPR